MWAHGGLHEQYRHEVPGEHGLAGKNLNKPEEAPVLYRIV